MRDSSGSPKSALANNEADTIRKLQQCYSEADEFCREVTEFVNDAGIPSMNELRYAGHHLLLALETNSAGIRIAKPDQVTQAVNHCRRAAYEAGEAGILMALEKITQFKSDFAKIKIRSVVPQWPDILRAARGAQKRITAARAVAEDRSIDRDAHMAMFRDLVTHCDTLDLGRDECVQALEEKLAEEDRRLDEKNHRKAEGFKTIGIFWGTIVIAIGTVILVLFAPEVRNAVRGTEKTAAGAAATAPTPKTGTADAPAAAPPAPTPGSDDASNKPPPS